MTTSLISDSFCSESGGESLGSTSDESDSVTSQIGDCIFIIVIFIVG